MSNIQRVKKSVLLAAAALLLGTTLQAQTVGGAVYGGGRKAGVAGTATVTIKSTSQKQMVTEEVNGVQTEHWDGQPYGIGNVYGGNDIASRVNGNVTVNLEGGVVLGNVFGGGNGDYGCSDYSTGKYTSSDDNNPDHDQYVTTSHDVPWVQTTTINVRGGGASSPNNSALVVEGAIYGGGNKAGIGVGTANTASSTINLLAGTIGYVYGGGRMAPIYGSSTINFMAGNQIVINQDVYAGNDIANTSDALTTGTVTVKGNPTINGAVYGGANGNYHYDGSNVYSLPYTSGDSPIATLCGGLAEPVMTQCTVLVQTAPVNGEDQHTIGTVFGGSNAANVTGNTEVTLASGLVGTVYGGNNIAGTISGGTTVTLNSGTVTGNVFGGCNGDYDYTSSTYASLSSPSVTQTQVTLNGATVNQNIYGGGNAAAVGTSGAYNGSTNVVLTSGTIGTTTIPGGAYAGGRKADVFGYATIETPANCHDLTVNGSIYGGNDIAGHVYLNPTNPTNRTITALDGTTLGANNAASYVKIQGAPSISGDVFGGGNGDYDYTSSAYAGLTAPDQTSAFVDIKMATGGTINRSFGGGNNVEVQHATTHIADLGGSDYGHIAEAYAGGNKATVSGSATLLFNATATANHEHPQVTTIFGGNNLAEMSIVPALNLTAGWVNTVYGGGNQGAMTANVTINEIPHLSTHVVVDNDLIHITDALYGGCRAANVGTPTQGEVGETDRVDGNGGTLVEVKRGTVNNVFGGNDVAQTCHYAHTFISGGTVTGNIFGGSNGFYDYDTEGNIYTHAHAEGATPITTISGAIRAAVDSSQLVISGGLIGLANQTEPHFVYGGGWAGDGTYAYTLVEGTAQLNNQLFGAGRGDVDKIGQCHQHLGNVAYAKTDLKSLDTLHSSITTAYGGGHSGDATNTELILHPSFQKHLKWLYGGGYAGNVTGTATTHIAGTPGLQMVDTVYGGNNYAGYVESTNLTILAGRYNNIYGAGNGAYLYKAELPASVTCYDTVPYSGHIVLNLADPATSDGIDTALSVFGNVYGGGNLGVVSLKHTGVGTVMPGEYGDIVVNVYNGRYANHIFGGARGREYSDPVYGDTYNSQGTVVSVGKRSYGRHQLAFAYKQVNMYNGYIAHSLYGGSEAVDDGYPFEFLSLANNQENGNASALLRPTGVVNVMGGRVHKNLYGGGYLGNIYGSVYVNIGEKAVDSSYVWTRPYASTTYGSYKPALASADLFLDASVYNGSDWGEAGANAVFNTRGFYGGESQILVDGQGYDTRFDESGAVLPLMDIHYSLFGAGTSTEGGDMRSQILVRNYGSKGYPTCDALTKSLYSIQRANKVLIENSFFTLTGEQDAYKSYASPDYSFNRIDTLIFRGENLVAIEAFAEYIGNVRSERRHRFFYPAAEEGVSLTVNPADYQPSSLYANTALDSADFACGANTAYCDKLSVSDTISKLLMRKGVYMSVLGYQETYENGKATGVNGNNLYGAIDGYMFLLPDNAGTRNYVYARHKDNSSNIHTGDGGFFSPCSNENSFTSNSYSDPIGTQLPYYNANRTGENNYRVWSVGDVNVDRHRAVALIANADVRADLCNDTIIGDAETSEMAFASGKVLLPPSAAGNFFLVNSIAIDRDNGGQVKLVSAACMGGNPQEWMVIDDTPEDHNANVASAISEISANKNYTFGLYMGVAENFGDATNTDDVPTIDPNLIHFEGDATAQCQNGTTLDGTDNFSLVNGFISPKVDLDAHDGVIPALDFKLTYNKNFNTTIIRQVELDLMEYDASCHQVGPVTITITIATVMRQFKNLETTLTAMYNEDNWDEFSRKIVLPAIFERTTLYLDSYTWDYDHSETTGADEFKLVDANAEKEDITKFGLSVKLTESLTDNTANSLGWYDFATDGFDLHKESGITTAASTGGKPYDTPLPLGTLDGRATAAIEATLHFDGNQVYDDDDNLGTAVLNVHAVGKNGTPVPFTITIHVKSRAAGDTFYVASREEVFTRTIDGEETEIHGFDPGPANDGFFFQVAPANKFGEADYGKRPRMYVKSIEEAMRKYEVGDVIAIIDSVNFTGEKHLTVSGDDHYRLQIIRYSGSHHEAPGKAYAYTGPMICLHENSTFQAINTTFNGSGFTRVKRLAKDEAEANSYHNQANGDGTIIVGNNISHVANDDNYNPYHWTRLPDTIWANAPMIVVRDNATLLFDRECDLINNFNSTPVHSWSDNPVDGFYPGGAIGVYGNDRTNPTVVLGNNVFIYDNATRGRGAAIYNTDGTVKLGVKENDSINITHNYQLPDASGSYFTTERKKVGIIRVNYEAGHRVVSKNDYLFMPLYKFNFSTPAESASTFASLRDKRNDREVLSLPTNSVNAVKKSMLSNVFLTRTPASRSAKPITDTYRQLNDVKSSEVCFNTVLRKGSRVGITKWFPGTNYLPYTVADPLCRDTIKFGRLTVSDPTVATDNLANRLFFDDSTTSYIFYHPSISQRYVYFQRCASFHQRSTVEERNADMYVRTHGDTLVIADMATMYKINRDSKCSAVLDTLEYRVQGGFYPYTYHWQCAPVPADYATTDGTPTYYYQTNSIDWSDTLSAGSYVKNIRHTLTPFSNKEACEDEQKRLLSSVDSCVTVNLVMIPTLPKLDFVYRVEANDLTGNCPLPKEIDIRVVRTEEDRYTKSEDARWLDKSSIDVSNPGMDSNHLAKIGLPDTTRTRYLRVCKGVHLGTSVAPSWNDGYITFTADYLQHDKINLQVNGAGQYVINNSTVSQDLRRQYFCPGDVLTVNTYKTPKAGQDDTSVYQTPSQFMMWDFEPQAPATGVTFTMPDHNYDIKAIYAPRQHWYERVTALDDTVIVTKADGTQEIQTPIYLVDYDGNVTIRNEAGLAWLISTANGLNYQQAQEFHNKRITVEPKENGYYMGDYLWTPLGTQNNPFSGRFDAFDTVEGGNPISGIICLEDNQTYVGFFGNVGHDIIDNVTNPGNASIRNLRLDNLTLKGNNYVGGIAAVINNGTEVKQNTIENASVISGAYMVGGIAAQANGSVQVAGNTLDRIDFLGNAIYVGAIAGQDVESANGTYIISECGETRYYNYSDGYRHNLGENLRDTNVFESGERILVYNAYRNNVVVLDTTLAEGQTATVIKEGNDFDITICTSKTVGSVYYNNYANASTVKMTSSGTEGAVNGTQTSKKGLRSLFGKPANVPQAYIANNYIRFRTSGSAMVAGGLMGQAQNANMVNNYVYGEVASQNNAGALLGYIGNNVSLDRCYYQDGTSVAAFGGGKQAKDGGVNISSFTGSGNQVRMAEKVYGVDNLTRGLNNWALAQRYAQGIDINTWRSDLENDNNGLPLFGQPDMIAVLDTAVYEVCDSYLWQGEEVTVSGVYYLRVVDSARYLDSNAVCIFNLHHSERDEWTDSVEAGQGYYDHGFSLSGEELQQLLPADADPQMAHTVELIDSLLTAHGCDSLVVLSLTIYPKLGIEEAEVTLFDVEVYPNPTLGMVTVESRHIHTIEVFDGVSRQVLTRSGLDSDRVQLDLSPYATGVYYLRITTEQDVAIKKVVKK